MNPFKKKKEIVPSNLPCEENGGNLNISISKKKIKNFLRIAIIVLVILVAAPRMINNIVSTTEIVKREAEKFPIIFPTLTMTGSTMWSFASDGIKNLSDYVSNNMALVAEILYSRKLDEGEVVEIQKENQNNLQEKPVRIIIEKVGIDSTISNPESTDITALDEALSYGVVRYPKSGLLGEKDNVYLFGHSTSYEVVRNQAYKALNGLNKLEAGDIIKIQSDNNEYLYKVTSLEMEKDSNIVVKFNTKKQTLTISTCNTLGNKEDRYIVRADFITNYPLEINSVSVNSLNNKSNTTSITRTTPKITNEIKHEYTVTPVIPANKTLTSDPNGKVDLTAQITTIGILDPITKEFIATTTLKNSDTIAFKFVVTNQGTKTAEGWSFNVVLPTSPLHMYHSNSQQNLGPEERIEYSLGFDRPEVNDNAVIIVNLDPAGTIWESNENNNIIKKFILIKDFTIQE